MKLADIFSGITIDFVLGQIENHNEDRVIELAFHHEASRCETLRSVVRRSQNGQRETMENLYQLLGSANPIADAKVTMSLMLRLEQEAVMDDSELDLVAIEDTLSRHMQVMFLAAVND